MKKCALLLCIAILATGLAACKREETVTLPDNPPAASQSGSEEPADALPGDQEEDPAQDGGEAHTAPDANMVEKVDAILALHGDAMLAPLDQTALVEQMHLEPEDVESFYGHYAMVITQVTHVVAVKAAEGHLEQVEAGLAQRKADLEAHYLPDQADTAAKGFVRTVGDTVYLVIIGHYESDPPTDTLIEEAQKILQS